MSKRDISAVERIIANTINETARGDPDDLAARIVAALTEGGFRIVSADGREDTALGPQRADARQLYRSPNGDTWFLARDPEFEPKMAEILCVYRQVAMLRGQAESGQSQGQDSGGGANLAIVSYDEKPGIQGDRYDRTGSPTPAPAKARP